ncbi:hypothetical protein B0H11DRAFT_2217603 [Mycena galericulata]|nr:hypothetical protein B0H11DRAFT_2217603 [Mycena galericulata]
MPALETLSMASERLEDSELRLGFFRHTRIAGNVAAICQSKQWLPALAVHRWKWRGFGGVVQSIVAHAMVAMVLRSLPVCRAAAYLELFIITRHPISFLLGVRAALRLGLAEA